MPLTLYGRPLESGWGIFAAPSTPAQPPRDQWTRWS